MRMSCGETRSRSRIGALRPRLHGLLWHSAAYDGGCYNRLEAFPFLSDSAAIPNTRVQPVVAPRNNAERGRQHRRVPATIMPNFFHFPRSQPRNTLPRVHPSSLEGIR
jgi:hypothetical protein